MTFFPIINKVFLYFVFQYFWAGCNYFLLHIGSHTCFSLLSPSWLCEKIIHNTEKNSILIIPSITGECAMQDLISKVLETYLTFITSISFRRRTSENFVQPEVQYQWTLFTEGALYIDIYLSIIHTSKALYPNSFFINLSLQLQFLSRKFLKNLKTPLLFQTSIVGSLLIFFPIV